MSNHVSGHSRSWLMRHPGIIPYWQSQGLGSNGYAGVRHKRRSPGSGPKNKRYFYAYSERMISNAIFPPLAAMLFESFSRIEPEDGVVGLDFPNVASDAVARYGALIVPPDILLLVANHVPYKEGAIAPRQSHSPDDTISLLFDWHLPRGGLTEAHNLILNGQSLVPYREPIAGESLDSLLKKASFAETRKIDFGFPLKCEGRSTGPSRKLYATFYSAP